MKRYFLILYVICLTAIAQPKNGYWRGVLMLNVENKLELPFNFDIKLSNKKHQLIIYNADERIVVDEIQLSKDSFNFKMPLFDSEFRTMLIGDTLLKGVWINHSRKENNKIVFTAQYGNSKRFDLNPDLKNVFYNGKWEVTFNPDSKESEKAIGVFSQTNNGETTTGTFLTETGDYRYLEGVVSQNKLYLSCFDGTHAYLFIAENNGSEIINADFYSANNWHVNWIGKRNNFFELSNPEQLTTVVSSDQKINFSFLNSDKHKISLSDKRYQNKPVIIQIMGTWCPNCMDETVYLTGIYNDYNKKGLELISLCYERTTDFEKSKANVLRYKKRFNLRHEILITELSGKVKASESLPFLSSISAFPTMIVLDRSHQVKLIHTGFSGPATGVEYEKFKHHIEQVIEEVLK